MKRILFFAVCAMTSIGINAHAFGGGHGGGGGVGPGHGGGNGPGPGGHGPGPQSQVCFYQDINYGGNHFCVSGPQNQPSLVQSGWNDQISSIYIQGNTSVDVFQDVNYGGARLHLNQSVADVRSYGGQWNDFISSYSIQGFQQPPPPPPPQQSRVCFYENANYTGQAFCLNPGQPSANLVPSGWNDRISSIYIQGDASVYIYQDINYGGQNALITQSVANLQSMNWNDAISSINVLHGYGRP